MKVKDLKGTLEKGYSRWMSKEAIDEAEIMVHIKGEEKPRVVEGLGVFDGNDKELDGEMFKTVLFYLK